MIQKETALQIYNLSKNNKITELKELLAQQQTRLGGHYFWDYHTDSHLIEGAARDAILAGHEDIVKLLFDAGLSPDAYAYIDDNNRGLAPLIHFAAQSGRLSTVKLMVEYGAKIYLTKRDNRDGWNDNYGLRTAVKEGHVDIVDYLLDCGADANGLCGGGTMGELYGGTTFLARAADDGNIHIFESLIRHGAKVPSTLNLAYEKIYVHGYREYISAIERNYSDRDRISKLEYAFNIFYQNRSTFNVNYSLTSKAKAFFAELNELLKDVDKLKNNEREKDNFLRLLTDNLSKQFNIIVNDKDRLKRDLNNLLNSLEEFDKKKRELQEKADKLKNSYTRIVRICMDYAIGCDFEAKSTGLFSGEYGGLVFLGDLDVSGMNFIGVSVAGKPVTQEILEKEAKSGAQNAILTPLNLMALDDQGRKDSLVSRLNTALDKKGRLVSKDGVINLIPLERAAAIGDVAAVKARVQAGEDPNLENGSPLVSAAQNGHIEIVKILFNAHAEHTANKANRLISEAREFISHNPSVAFLSVVKGRVHKTSIPLTPDKYQIILPGNKKLTSVMHMLRGIGKDTLNNAIQTIALDAEAKNQNFIVVVNHDRSIKLIEYSNLTDRKALIETITPMIKLAADEWNYFPAIFTNSNNFDVIETLIISQYQDAAKSKTASIEAIEAARKQNHIAIVEFLQDNQDVNQQDNDGNTLLHKAIKTGDLERVRELILKGADVNLENKDGQTPLSIAAKYSGSEWDMSDKHTKIVQILLENKADPNKFKWSSPLELAINAGNTKVVAMLLPVTIKNEIIRKSYLTPEHKELRRDPWYVDMMFSALHKKDGIALLTLLKEYGADFNVKSEYGSTLLNEAIYALPSFSNITSTMSDLVRGGYGAAHMRNALEKTQKQLIEDSEKYFQDELKMLDFLFENGADPRIGGRDGQTPLALLIDKKDLNYLEKAAEIVMDRFMNHGANVNAVDDNGFTPLHEAARTGDLVAIEYLLKHGADINCQSKTKRTPLHCAAACGNQLSTKLLLEEGADFTLLDEDGLNPLQLSAKAMVNDKKIYSFSSITAEREFESKYIAAQNIIKEFISKHTREALKKRAVESGLNDIINPQKKMLSNKNKNLTVIFDIDDTLAGHSSIEDEEKLYFLRKSALISAAEREHQVFPGVIELMRFLYSKDNIEVAFFSSGQKQRNVEFVEKLLIKALGPDRYQVVKPSLIILSRDDLTPEDRLKSRQMYENFGLSAGNFKKDITKVTDSTTLENVILADDDSTYVYYGQEKNFLRCPSGESKYYNELNREYSDLDYQQYKDKEYFFKFNTAFYLAGMLAHCIEVFEKGENVNAFLFNKHFTKSSNKLFGFQPTHECMEDKTIFEKGLECLKTINPEICFVSREDYINTLNTPASEEENQIIDGLKTQRSGEECLIM
ncbi:ankyrin repeat domain-containing protein [Legionella sp. D16C41]|uniref:ankyrin repeat domain-containing protein n=1 Tax=Legionella sp. D16C41 TaxID=3402688 RepID=UPI003AF9EEC3